MKYVVMGQILDYHYYGISTDGIRYRLGPGYSTRDMMQFDSLKLAKLRADEQNDLEPDTEIPWKKVHWKPVRENASSLH